MHCLKLRKPIHLDSIQLTSGSQLSQATDEEQNWETSPMKEKKSNMAIKWLLTQLHCALKKSYVQTTFLKSILNQNYFFPP